MNMFLTAGVMARIRAARLVVCVLCVAVPLESAARGQAPDKPAAGGGTSNELVEGLLDLLAEPKSAAKVENARPQPMPAEVGLEGEDVGEASNSNPLNSVRQNMLIAAGYLRKGVTTTQTQQLQANIVDRLDEIIKGLEETPPPNRSPRGQPQSSAEQRQQLAQRQSQQPAAKSPKSPGADDVEPSTEPGQANGVPDDRPTAPRGSSSLAVDLADPKALQQSVWGQLPERVRQQMQSRMVEQFLPAYREQIEAYFQALLK